MELIMHTTVQDPKAMFHKQWTTVFGPAILCYGEKSKKKSIVNLLDAMNPSGGSLLSFIFMGSTTTDESSRQMTALKVLVEVMTTSKKIHNASVHIFEEREVGSFAVDSS